MDGAASRTARRRWHIGGVLDVFSKPAKLIFGQRIAAMIGLTWKAAFRFRLFLVIAVLLLAAVVGLPLLIRDDGTARGFTQILITYTLSVVTALLGLSTLWLACGTLARDIEECQVQMLAVKPIARWQIWMGKWLGIMSINAVLLSICGVSIYCLLQYRASRLPPGQQAVLRNEVLVSRGSGRPKNR
jgi:ABC-type transport system involved in multi-copper enzyme maturation permease subunit